MTNDYEIAGHKVRIVQQIVGRRLDLLRLPEEEVLKIPEANLVEVKDPEPQVFPKKEPPKIALAGQEAANENAWTRWRAEKAEWEQHNAVPEGIKEVKVWMPVLHVHEATLDGRKLRIFHTLRGPMIGAVDSEDMHYARLYSPALLDPNIQKGKIHFMPLAFAGLEFTVYKLSCIGISIPQLAEIRGYPHFVENNRQGDYQFRMKAAYHHVEADIPDDARVVSVEAEVRGHQEGVVPTSDTREEQVIRKTRQMRHQQEAAEMPEEPAPEAPVEVAADAPPVPPVESPPPATEDAEA